MRSVLVAVAVFVPLAALSSASEIWVAPAVHPPNRALGDWPITSSGSTHFSFAVPDDLVTLVSAKAVVIGERSVDQSYDLRLSVAQNAVRHNAYTASALGIPISYLEGMVMEIDVSSVFPALLPGEDYVSLAFDTKGAHVVGLRVSYESSTLTADALAEETAARIAADAALQVGLASERDARIAGDAANASDIAALWAALSAETNARAGGDSGLQAALDELTSRVETLEGQGGPWIVFVTSTTHNGNLGGLSGADTICNELAAAAGLPGEYKAWLSDSTADAIWRFSRHDGPYVRVDGEVIAWSWLELVNAIGGQPFLRHSISFDENGALVPPGDTIWTATNPSGERMRGTPEDCANWTTDSEDTSLAATVGSPHAQDIGWTLYLGMQTCNWSSRLYCFQQ